MAVISGVLTTVVPVLAALIIGVVMRRTKLISREGVTALKSIVCNVTLPAMLVGVFAKVNYSPYSLAQTGMIFLMCFGAVYIGRLLSKPLGLTSPFAALCCAGSEGGMLGYALITLLYGAGSTTEFAILDLGGGIFINTVFRAILNNMTGEKKSAGSIAKEVLGSPVTVCMILGILMGASGIYALLPQWGLDSLFNEVTDFIGAPTSAIILFAIGYDLSFSEFKEPACVKTLLLRLMTLGIELCVAIPFCMFVLHVSDMTIKALLLLCLLPCSFMLPVYSDEPSERSYISGSISVQTVFTIAAFGVLAVLGI